MSRAPLTERSLAAATGLLLVAWCLREDVQPDLYFHLAAGREIADNGLPTRSDVFLATPFPEHPFVDHEWLFQLIIFPLYELGGAALLTLIKSLVVLLTFALLATAARRYGSQLRWAVLAVALVVAGGRFILRPEVFSFLGVTLHLFLLTRGRPPSRRVLIGLPLFQVVWSNAHGFSLLGPVLIVGTIAACLLHLGIEAAGRKGPETGGVTRSHGSRKRLGAPLGWSGIKRLVALLGLELLASLINPYGVEAALYPWWVLSRAGQDSASAGLSYRVVELVSPFDGSLSSIPEIQVYRVWLVTAPLLYLVALFRGRTRLEEGVLGGLLAATSVLYLRNLPFAAIGLVLPTCAGLATLGALARPRLREMWPSARQATGLVAIVGVLLLTRAVLADRFHDNASFVARPGVDLGEFPTYAGSVEFLESSPPEGKLFNNFGAGHYLIYAQVPARPSICGNTDLYPRKYLDRYHRIMRGELDVVEELDRLGVSDALLDHRVEVEKHVLSRLLTHPDWALVYADQHALIFRRGGRPLNLDALAYAVRHEWTFADEEPDRFGITRGLRSLALLPRRRVKPILRLQAAELLELLGRVDDALAVAEKARRLAPESPMVIRTLANLTYERRPVESEEHYLKLTELTPHDSLPWVKLGLLALRRGDAKLAVERLERAEAISPHSPLARENLLTALEVKKDPVELRRALHRMGDDLRPAKRSYYAGVAAYLEGDLERAEQGFAAAVEADPELGPALSLLAEVQGRRGKLEAAETSWVRLCALNPKDGSAWHALGRIRLARKRYPEAVEAWREAARVDPKDVNSLIFAARLHLERDERTEARELAWEARRRNPRDPRVLRLLRRIGSRDRD